MTSVISIHAPLAGSDILVHFLFPDSRISIHAPLAGSDGTFEADPTYSMDFNPRSPCGERPNSDEDEGRNGIFQSTLPLRGATTGTGYIPADVPISIHAPLAGSDRFASGGYISGPDFNPRSPCGERLAVVVPAALQVCISIHAPLAGSDSHGLTSSKNDLISIHAPLAGSDHNNRKDCAEQSDFNPRSPCGERRAEEAPYIYDNVFQSTLPLRGATLLTVRDE